MLKIMKGVWGEKSDTDWEFYLSDKLPDDAKISAMMGIPFWNGEIALTKTKRGWEIPGGHMEDGESADECLERELNEEIGSSVIVSKKLFGFRQITNPDRKVYGTEERNNYPRKTVMPYYLVELGADPAGHCAEDCLDSGLFDVCDSEIRNSDDYEIIILGYALRANN